MNHNDSLELEQTFHVYFSPKTFSPNCQTAKLPNGVVPFGENVYLGGQIWAFLMGWGALLQRLVCCSTHWPVSRPVFF